MLRRSAAAEYARVCRPGAVVLYATGRTSSPPLRQRALSGEDVSTGCMVNGPGRDVEVGLFRERRFEPASICRDGSLRRSAVAGFASPCVSGAVVLCAAG